MHSFLPDDNHITNLGSCSPPFYDRNVCISHIEFQVDATLWNCDCLRGSSPRVEGLLVPYKLSGAPRLPATAGSTCRCRRRELCRAVRSVRLVTKKPDLIRIATRDLDRMMGLDIAAVPVPVWLVVGLDTAAVPVVPAVSAACSSTWGATWCGELVRGKLPRFVRPNVASFVSPKKPARRRIAGTL
jgi:hypothetical protein